MATTTGGSIAEIIDRNEKEVLAEWMRHQLDSATMRRDLIGEEELRDQSFQFLRRFRAALERRPDADLSHEAWKDVKDMLAELSTTRARRGFSPSETAMFVFSLKRPLFERLRRESEDTSQLADDLWITTVLLDRLGLFTTEMYQKTREEVIARQQQDMLELSTPVVQLSEGVLALPVIGTLDSARTQVVMETLLTRIVETGSGIAIIDITGVPTVDTLVAQHLLKTISAARLMGADCILSGIRPQIAQTIVHLGVDLQDIVTKSTLADAFAVALARTGRRVGPIAATAPIAR